MARILCLLSLVVAICLSGCASRSPVEISRTAATADDAWFWESVGVADVVYVGEVHDDQNNHQYELELVRGALAHHLRIAIGWEMFTRSQQRSLDQFDRHRISLEELLAQTGFQRSWGVYSPLYAKILGLTSETDVRNIALNASNDLVHRVAMGEALSPEEQDQLPEGFAVSSRAYDNFIRLMGNHPDITETDLRRYFNAQNIWDQTMADSILAFHQQNPKTKLIVVTGRGHIQNGFGVPSYVAQKSKLKQLLLFPPAKNDVTNQKAV
jgi:aminopeptidase N